MILRFEHSAQSMGHINISFKSYMTMETIEWANEKKKEKNLYLIAIED
jgi:hypothetical protein